MGKKQHQKDKLYLTTTEWSDIYGGKKSVGRGPNAAFRRLPYNCCCLSLQPFVTPYCTLDGYVFDCENIVKFLKRHGTNPVTGEPLQFKSLVKLNFFKNTDNHHHCPVTFKVFNENTHIVTVRTTGNVFCFDAVDRFNVKINNLRDLVTDVPFVRKDVITIQDPLNLDKFNFANFAYIKNNLTFDPDDDDQGKKFGRGSTLNSKNHAAKQALEILKTTTKAPEKVPEVASIKVDKVNAAHYSTGKVSASFTSTILDPVTQMEPAAIDEDELRYARITGKAYVQLETNFGNLNVELHSDHVPKTCHNFLQHCLDGYYDGTVFHRSIKNFMIQGGDPEGTGRGGRSIWGRAFKNEFKFNLTHSGRGVLSMANSGPDSNQSQFFITFKSAKHLDKKHAVFGRVVGGQSVLDKMEAVETDSKDRPLEDIKIIRCKVFSNPYAEADKMLEEERAKGDSDSKKELAEAKEEDRFGDLGNLVSVKRTHEFEGESDVSIKKKSKIDRLTQNRSFNFSGWN